MGGGDGGGDGEGKTAHLGECTRAVSISNSVARGYERGPGRSYRGRLYGHWALDRRCVDEVRRALVRPVPA